MAGKGRPKGQGNKQRESMSAMRLSQVEEAMLQGRSHSWCMEAFAKAWDVTPRQVQNYLKRVEALWQERAPAATTERRSEARERVLMLLRRCLRDTTAPGALGAACKAADMLNKLDGAYAPAEVKHSGTIDVTSLTPEQRQKRIAELLAKAGQGSEST